MSSAELKYRYTANAIDALDAGDIESAKRKIDMAIVAQRKRLLIKQAQRKATKSLEQPPPTPAVAVAQPMVYADALEQGQGSTQTLWAALQQIPVKRVATIAFYLFSVWMLALNIQLFSAFSIAVGGWVMGAAETVGAIYIVWSLFTVGALLKTCHPGIAGVIAVSAVWMYLDRVMLGIAFLKG